MCKLLLLRFFYFIIAYKFDIYYNVEPLSINDIMASYQGRLQIQWQEYLALLEKPNSTLLCPDVLHGLLTFLSAQHQEFGFGNILANHFEIDMSFEEFREYFSVIKEEKAFNNMLSDEHQCAEMVTSEMAKIGIKFQLHENVEMVRKIQKEKSLLAINRIKDDINYHRQCMDFMETQKIKSMMNSQYTWYVVGGIGVAVTSVILFKYTQTLPPLN